MIKNLLYSLFIHFLLFSTIYFAFTKKDYNEIEEQQEVLVSIVNSDSKGAPPINEEMQKPKKDIEKPVENSKKIEEEIIEPEIPIEETPQVIKNEKIIPKTLKKIIKSINKKEPKPKKNENADSAILKNNDNKNENEDVLKVMNLKAFKNVKEDENGLTLTARETINIQSQLKLCYKRALEESGFESKTKIIIKIEVSQDGYIQNDLDDMIDLEKYNNPTFKDYKIVIDNVKRALELCSPLRNLPIEKYESWKEIILQFDVGKD